MEGQTKITPDEEKTKSGPKFYKPETIEICREINGALAIGDFNTVIRLATQAAGLEAKARYDLDVADSQNKIIEKTKNDFTKSCDLIASKFNFLIGETKMNPFLNFEYKSEFDEFIAKILGIASSASMRKKYDFEENLTDLIGSLKDKLSKMRDSHMKRNQNEEASMDVGMAVKIISEEFKNIQEYLRTISSQEVPWEKIVDLLRKLS